MTSEHDLDGCSPATNFKPAELIHDRVMRRTVETGQFRLPRKGF